MGKDNFKLNNKKKSVSEGTSETCKIQTEKSEKEHEYFSNQDISMLKELLASSKEDGRMVSEQNNSLLNFYDKQLNRIDLKLKENLTDKEKNELTQEREEIFENAKVSVEKTQEIHAQSQKETIKYVVTGLTTTAIFAIIGKTIIKIIK